MAGGTASLQITNRELMAMMRGAELDQRPMLIADALSTARHHLKGQDMPSESTPTGDRQQFRELLESFNTVALITHSRAEAAAGADQRLKLSGN